MKQTSRIISTYTADSSGVCSALFELGGMSVMHDASGCNSTYCTHDEPRWYDTDSLVFISALTEMEAIMGDDDKLIRDTVRAAEELKPRFIALAGTPIPMMVGTDLPALARACEKRTGIPAFGFNTNGMHSYLTGASKAFDAIIDRFVTDCTPTEALSANILGLTPPDFSVNGQAQSIRSCLEAAGFEVISTLAMGSTLEDISRAGSARVNLVVSHSGLSAARRLQRRFGTPYVVGVPIHGFADRLVSALRAAAESGENALPARDARSAGDAALGIIGESVFSASLASALELSHGVRARLLCPLETDSTLLLPQDRRTPNETDVTEAMDKLSAVIADPLYKPVCPEDCRFFALPHEAFSGRIYRREIPNLMAEPINLREVL